MFDIIICVLVEFRVGDTLRWHDLELHQPVTMAKPWRVHRNFHAVRVLHCSKRLRLEPAASARNFGLQNGMPPRRITFKGYQKSRCLWLQGISSRWNHKNGLVLELRQDLCVVWSVEFLFGERWKWDEVSKRIPRLRPEHRDGKKQPDPAQKQHFSSLAFI